MPVLNSSGVPTTVFKGDLAVDRGEGNGPESVVTATQSAQGVGKIEGFGGFEDLKRFFGVAWDLGMTPKYVVAGDSTRDNAYNKMISYYLYLLNKIGVTVVDNAESGQSGKNWKDNIGTNTLNQAIAASGDGTNVVFEFSFGINDWPLGSTSVESWLTEGLAKYIAACPNARVLLVTPVCTSNSARNTGLQTIYRNLAAKFNAPLIDVLAITSAVFGNASYYFDTVHPNQYGSVRVVNYILDKILPAEMYPLCKMDIVFFAGQTPPNTDNLATAVQTGYWSVTDGSPQPNAAWRRMLEIAIEPNFILRVKHQGNLNDVVIMDAAHVFVTKLSSIADGSGWREVTIPTTGRFARINITSNGAAYDALSDVIEVRYKIPSAPDLTMAQINTGLSLRLPSS